MPILAIMGWLNGNPQVLYGALALVALGLTAISGRHVLIKIALFLLLEWVASNLIEAATGYERAPLLLPITEAVIGTLVGIIALRNRSQVAAVVFVLFFLSCGLWAGAFGLHGEASPTCYLLANLLFALRVLVLGGAGARIYLADRPHRRPLRLRGDLARG